MGESINSVEMELEPDGSILLLARVGMYYAREGRRQIIFCEESPDHSL